MALNFTVFDVGRGLSVLIVTPNNYSILIDCGCSAYVNPVDYMIAYNQIAPFTKRNGYSLTYMVISHPHSDHITAIKRIHADMRPSMILRRKNLDWKRVENSNSDNKVLDFYLQNFFPPKSYGVTVEPAQFPDWGDGMTIQNFSIASLTTIDNISTSDTSYVNNSSFITVIKYRGYTLAIGGDMEKEGMNELLRIDSKLVNAIRGSITDPGVDFFVCPHHGHSSGFCQRWFDIAGPTRIFNIVSERLKGEHEDGRQTAIKKNYSDIRYCLGQNHEGKKMVSTKLNGSISVIINNDNRWSWNTF